MVKSITKPITDSHLPGYKTAEGYFSRLGISSTITSNNEFLKEIASRFSENEIAAMVLAVETHRTTQKLRDLKQEMQAILDDTGK